MTQCSPFNYTKSLKKPESKGTEPHNLERQKRKRKRKKKKNLSLEVKSFIKISKLLTQIKFSEEQNSRNFFNLFSKKYKLLH